MDKQLLGSVADLQRNSPLNVELEATGAGHPMEQLLGQQADISRTPYNLMPLNEAGGHPEKQLLGEMAPLSMTPNRGYEQGTPMSDRAWKAGK